MDLFKKLEKQAEAVNKLGVNIEKSINQLSGKSDYKIYKVLAEKWISNVDYSNIKDEITKLIIATNETDAVEKLKIQFPKIKDYKIVCTTELSFYGYEINIRKIGEY